MLALTNSSGNITTQYGYDPFGNTTGNGGSSTNVFQYTGRENDNNGLYSFRARYYSPTFGRFISEDPIGFDGGDSNLYRYVWNSPTGFVDPLGLWTGVDDAVFAGGGALVGLAGQAFSDMLAGQMSGWQDYVGAGVGGAVGGEGLLYLGPVAAGAAGGFAGNETTQILNHFTKGCSFSLASAATATGVGAITGLFPGYEIPGITQGSNSFNAVFKQMVTKFGNGTASSVAWDTAWQMFIGRAASTGLAPGVVGVAVVDAATSETAGRSCRCE